MSSYSCSHMNLHMLQVHTDVLCRTKLKLVYYLLFMLPNLPLPTVAQQPARALSTGKISPQSASATLTILAGHLSPSQWSFCLHSAPQFSLFVFGIFLLVLCTPEPLKTVLGHGFLQAAVRPMRHHSPDANRRQFFQFYRTRGAIYANDIESIGAFYGRSRRRECMLNSC